MAEDSDIRAVILGGLWPEAEPERLMNEARGLRTRNAPRLLAIALEEKPSQAPVPLAYLTAMGEQLQQQIYNVARSMSGAAPDSAGSTMYLQLIGPDGRSVQESASINREAAARLLIEAAMASWHPPRFVATMLADRSDAVIEHFRNNPIPRPVTDAETPESQ